MAAESEILIRVIGQRHIYGRCEPASDHVVTTMNRLTFEPMRDVDAHIEHERFKLRLVSDHARVARVEPDAPVQTVGGLAGGRFAIDVAGLEVHDAEATA